MENKISLSTLLKVLPSILSHMAEKSYEADYYSLESQRRFNEAHTDDQNHQDMSVCYRDDKGIKKYSTCLNPLGRLSVKLLTMPFRVLMEAIRLPFVLISTTLNTLFYNGPKIGYHLLVKKEFQTIITCLNVIFDWIRPLFLIPAKIAFFAIEPVLEIFATMGVYFNAKKGLNALLKLRESIVYLDGIDYSVDTNGLYAVERRVKNEFDRMNKGILKETKPSLILDYILPQEKNTDNELNPDHEFLDEANIHQW